jgi:hypothetical protein
LGRYRQLTFNVKRLIEQNRFRPENVDNDKFIYRFKTATMQFCYVYICVFESDINNRGKKNSHHKQNNQTHIGKAMDHMKKTCAAQDSHLIYCTNLDPESPIDIDIVTTFTAPNSRLTFSLEELGQYISQI